MELTLTRSRYTTSLPSFSLKTVRPPHRCEFPTPSLSLFKVLQIPWTGCGVSLRCFTHPDVCFRCYYLPKNYETRRDTRASSDEEVEEPGFRWISNRVGEESYLGPFDVDVDFLSFLFFFFATSVDVRDFSVRITWRETQWPRVEWIIYFLKRYTSFFFSSFPFLNASYEGYVPFADTDVRTVGGRNLCTWGRKKRSIAQRSKMVKDIKGIFW